MIYVSLALASLATFGALLLSLVFAGDAGDLSSLVSVWSLIPLLCPVLMILPVWGWRGIARSFAVLHRPDANKQELASARLLFAKWRHMALVTGGASVLIEQMAILRNLTDRARLWPRFAESLTGLLWAVLIAFLVLWPLELSAAKRLAALRDRESGGAV